MFSRIIINKKIFDNQKLFSHGVLREQLLIILYYFHLFFNSHFKK